MGTMLINCCGEFIKPMLQYPILVEVPIVVCNWYLKYSMHMLDMSDVIVDVIELYLKCK